MFLYSTFSVEHVGMQPALTQEDPMKDQQKSRYRGLTVH